MKLIPLWNELVLENFIPVTGFWLICLIIALAMRNRFPVFAYWLALLGLLRPFVPLRWQILLQNFPLGARIAKLPGLVVTATERSEAGILSLLFYLWLGICLAMLLLYLWRLSLLTRQAKSFVRRYSVILDGIARRLGLRWTPELFSHSGIRMPFTWGVARPAIVVSEELIGWDASLQAPVLAHEAAHIARGDNLALVLENLVTAALFFNPVLWLLRRFLRVQREILADRTALGLTGNDPLAYGRILLANAELCIAGSGVINHFAQHRLKKRIKRLFHLKEVPMPAFTRFQKAALIVLLAGLYLLSAGHFKPISATTTMPSHEKPVLVMDGDQPPQVLYRVNPSYPPDMSKEGWTADVILLIVIDADGTVKKVKSAVSTRTREEKGQRVVRVSELKDDPFSKAAIDAVMKWRFTAGGEEIQVKLPVAFKLK